MKSVTKRILIMFCCTMFLTSSVFMSYENTLVVKAVDESDLLHDCILAVLAAIGVYATGGSAGTLAMVLAPFITDTGFDIYDYITQDETAGTTTISADFVNLVLQAYKRYQEENGVKFDGSMETDENGYYYFPDFTCTLYDQLNPDSATYYNHVIYTDIYTYYPCAVLLRNYYKWNASMYQTSGYVIYYNASHDEFFCMENIYENGVKVSGIIGPANASFLNPKKAHMIRQSDNPYTGDSYFTSLSGYMNVDNNLVITARSSSIPIYHDLSSLMAGLRSGDFSGAYNYGKSGECETPAYTGTYDGGDITVPTEKLEGIQDKLDEIDKTDKDIYEKLKELLEWLIGNTGGAGGSIDLTTTNSWLEKIYIKVSQIFDTISGTVNTKLQETLDEILSTLKSIRRWTIADTVFDGLDALADIASFLKDFLTAPAAAIGTAASSLGETANMLTDKFPFSIPWDMAALVTLLSAEPQAPVFKLPIVIESYGIEEYMEIDMSQFEYLSTIMRGMLSIIYAYGILSMTTKVIDIGGKK